MTPWKNHNKAIENQREGEKSSCCKKKMDFDFKETVRKQLTSQSKWWKLENNGNHIQIAERKEFPTLNSVPGKILSKFR